MKLLCIIAWILFFYTKPITAMDEEKNNHYWSNASLDDLFKNLEPQPTEQKEINVEAPPCPRNEDLPQPNKEESKKRKVTSKRTNTLKKRKTSNSWFDNFSKDLVKFKFENDDNVYILECHLELVINTQYNDKNKNLRYLQRHIDNYAKKYGTQTISLSSKEHKKIWDLLNLKPTKNFKKFRIINLTAFNDNGILHNYVIKSMGKKVSNIWNENQDKFKQIIINHHLNIN